MTQIERILEDLKAGKAITPLDALREYRCFRLGARIWDLKRRGLEIETSIIETDGGSHVAQYRLVKSARPGELFP